MYKNKKIMIIGSSWEQKPLFKKANELGLYIISTNPFIIDDPYPNFKDFDYDECFIIDPRNLIKLDELFQKVKPDAIISDACDYSMFAVAYLTNKYKIPGPNMDALIITNNKYLERKFADKGGILQPKYKLCMTFNDVYEAVDEIGLPVMLKPVDNRGSIGIKKLTSKNNLENNFYHTLSYSHARQVLVEEYIDPDNLVNIEGIYTDKFYNLTYSNKKKYPNIYADKYLEYPGNLSENIVNKLYKINEKLVKTIGINYGLIHTEFIIKNNKIYLLEIHNRGGGINVSNKIVPSVTNVNVPEILIHSSFGKKISLNPKKRGCAILYFFDFGKGLVSEIKNIDKIKNMNGVLTLWINFNVGDYLNNIETGPNRHGCVIVTAESIDKCKSIINDIENKIKVVFYRNN